MSICMRIYLFRADSSDFEIKVLLKLPLKGINQGNKILPYQNAAVKAYIQIRGQLKLFDRFCVLVL
jgi:hypothetical protein